MKNKIYLIVIGLLIFLGKFFYLEQKVNIYLSAYRLSRNYRIYSECIDRRDYLMHNLMHQLSVNRLNEWGDKYNFAGVEQERIVVLSLRREVPSNTKDKNKFTQLLRQLTHLPTPGSGTALAGEKR